jgi:DNA-binding response OmpR family regulator
MHVLVIDENKLEREAFARALQTANHQVAAVGDVKIALTALAREPAQVVVYVGLSAAAVDVLRKLRATQGAAQHLYFLAILEKVMPGDVSALFAAGADDFMRKPPALEELMARVEAPCRIRRYAATLLASSAYDWSSSVDLSALRAFADTGTVVAGDLAQVVGECLAVTEGAPKNPRASILRCATIPLSLATEGLEVRVSVIADPTALCAIAKAVMGDDALDDAGQRDLLRELANTAGGALKRAYGAENISLTTGLPVDDAAPLPSETTRWWIGRAKDAGATLGFACEVRARKNERVPAAGLREGMVISSDLRNDSGALLVAAGTRLTATSAERVSRALGEMFLVEVACAA